jgi:3-deoxy-7-phosphoheptulonate synthase
MDKIYKNKSDMNIFSRKRTFGPTPNYPLVMSYKPPYNGFTLISGTCSIESETMVYETAMYVSACGATHLRGGVFMAGTYPGKNFGWVNKELMKSYYTAARDNDLKNIIEVLDYRDIAFVDQYCFAFQVGARQQQNYVLLKELGKTGKPVFLKRNMGSTVDEWLGSAEYLLDSGCRELYLIERGSSTYHNDVRWTPTVHTIASVKSLCDIPVIFDPSHSSGRRDIVSAMALAGVAAGAKGLLIETHPDPEKSISDSEQALSFEDYKKLIEKVNKLREVL